MNFYLFKKAKKGGLILQDRGADMARENDVARGTLTNAMRHARPRGGAARPTRCASGAQVAHRCCGRMAGATRIHAVARVAPHARGAGIWRAYGLVGPGYRIGAVTQ